MEPLYDFDLDINLVFFLTFTGKGKIPAAAFRTEFPVAHRMAYFLVHLFRPRLFQGMALVSALPAFRLPCIPAAVRDMPVFPRGCLAGWGGSICAIPAEQGCRMGELCRQPMDHGILFRKLPLIILDDGGNLIIGCFQDLPVFIHQFLDLLFFLIQFGLVFFPV